MKIKTLLMAVFALTAILFTAGCSDSPTDVVEKWRDAIVDGDVNKANEYSTENVHVLNSFMVKAIKKDADDSKEFKEAKFVKEEINGDAAKVFSDKRNNAIDLKKVDGKWKVDVKK